MRSRACGCVWLRGCEVGPKLYMSGCRGVAMASRLWRWLHGETHHCGYYWSLDTRSASTDLLYPERHLPVLTTSSKEQGQFTERRRRLDICCFKFTAQLEDWRSILSGFDDRSFEQRTATKPWLVKPCPASLDRNCKLSIPRDSTWYLTVNSIVKEHNLTHQAQGT